VMESYVAIDVETANYDISSICQIGAVQFENGKSARVWESLIDPETFFDGMNVSIHGITEHDVLGAPVFSDALPQLNEMVADQVVICHTHFDRLAFHRAAERYGLQLPSWTWLDSAKIVRRVWSQFSHTGYALAKCAKELGIEFQHHRASEDARAAGEIVALALRESGLSLAEWLTRVRQPILGYYPSKEVAREGNLDGPLTGEVVVFTGALQIPRAQAADLAAEAGCDVAKTVTKKTTLLVVGDQDIQKLAGHSKSSKHRKAEALIEKGQELRILGESDFQSLVGLMDQR